MEDFVQDLLEAKDGAYREFHLKLIPDVPPDRVIGIRVPMLRKMAKRYQNDYRTSWFLSTLPHFYYEENNLHAFIIELEQDFDLCIEKLNRFLPFADNWATCDSLRPICFKKNRDQLVKHIDRWLNEEHLYTKRFAIVTLMVHFLESDFRPEYLKRVGELICDEYYLGMAVAWYFATALSKQYEVTIQYLLEGHLSDWVHNKTIQKAVESNRISNEIKMYLKTLKRKSI